MLNKYPGDGAYYIYCDICGAKIRARDAMKTHGTRGRLLVCRNDYEDPHPQDTLPTPRKPRKLTELRSEATDTFSFIDTVAEIETGETTSPSYTTTGAPKELRAEAANSTSIVLTWSMEDVIIGTGGVTGYKIERETPVGGGFSTVTANTNLPSLYYLDESLSASTTYNYRVSAVNGAGAGSVSNEAASTTPTS